VRRFRRAAAVATLSLTTLAACGGDGAGTASESAPSESTTTTTAAPTPLELVLASSDKVAGINTMHFAATMAMPQGSFTAEGAFDIKAPLMSMTMDIGSLIPPAERKAGTKASMLLNDQAMYMTFPGLAKETGGKNWMRLDLASLGEDNVFGALFETMREADPSKNVAFLEGAEDVTTVGVEDVRGTSTTHYRFTIDMQKAATEAPEKLRKFVTDALAEMGDVKTLPAEVWLDAGGMPRRMVYEMPVPTGVAGESPITVKVSMDMFDFDKPVTVTLPADTDVIDAGSLSGAEDEEVMS